MNANQTIEKVTPAPVGSGHLVRRLWLLRPVDGLPDNNNPWEPWYDKSFGFVVCADSEDEARQMAHKGAGDENRGEFLSSKTADTQQPWMDAKYSTCIELTPAREKGVVIEDFRSA